MRMDEATVFSGPFLFVSYSHMDAELVREDVTQLIDQGARIWIDHRNKDEGNLALSDHWVQKVRSAIDHPNCRGVIFYVSKYSLASKAGQVEHRLVYEKLQKSKDFRCYFVSIGGEKINAHLNGAISLCNTRDSDWFNEHYVEFFSMDGSQTILCIQQTLFNDSRLFIPRQSRTECVMRILSEIAAPLGAVDDTGALRSNLADANIASRDTGEIILGIYKGEKSEPVARNTENARFALGSSHYIHHNGEVYKGRPLKWKLLYTKDATAVLICSEVVEKYPFVKIPDFFEVFRQLAFTAAEANAVQNIRLLTVEDEAEISENERSALLALSGDQAGMYWWTGQDGILPNWKITYKNGSPVTNGFLVTRPKGVRPVIEIASKDLKK